MSIQWRVSDRTLIVINGKVYTLITLEDLYRACVADPTLFVSLVNDLDGTLESHGWAMYKKCYDSLKEIIDLFKQGKPYVYGKKELKMSDVEAWVKSHLEWLKWKTKSMEGPPCPWDQCPPGNDERLTKKRPVRRPRRQSKK